MGLALIDGAFPEPKRVCSIRPRVSSSISERQQGADCQIVHGNFMDGTDRPPTDAIPVCRRSARRPYIDRPDLPRSSHQTVGAIPEAECRTLIETLRDFTTIPDNCYFCLWEGWGNIEPRLYKAGSSAGTPHRNHLLFSGLIDAIMALFATDWPRGNVWSKSQDLWWPRDRSWCVGTDIDLCYTYIGSGRECIEAVLNHPYLEALPTTIYASTYLISDTINAPEKFQGSSK